MMDSFPRNSNRARLFAVMFVVLLAAWPLVAVEDPLPAVADLTLGGWGPPPGPYDVTIVPEYNPVPPRHIILQIDLHSLVGVSQIPLDARIQEVRVRVSSGTFGPGDVPVSMRPILKSGEIYYQVPTAQFDLPHFSDPLEIYGVDAYAEGGGAVLASNPFTGQPWQRSDLATLQAGTFARWENLTFTALSPQRLSFNDYTVQVVYRGGPVPTLTADATSVERGATVRFMVNAQRNAVISNWSFSGPDVSTVTRTVNTDATTWRGRMVSSGSVSVRVVQNGETFNLTQPITVTPRNWSWVPVSPRAARDLTTFISPPQEGTRIGISSIGLAYSFNSILIGDQGPNHGVIYVESLRDSAQKPRATTEFRYQITDDLDRNAAFYKAQCGTWSPQNSNGIISGATLRSNLEEHEYGTVLGHYQQYGATLQNPGDNLGDIAEARVRKSSDLQGFNDELQITLNAARLRIRDATLSEACNANATYDPTCATLGPDQAFRGFVNYSPYVPCP